MHTEPLGEAKAARKVVFHRVAKNLYRLETSGGYYALLKRGDKQFRRSLKTKDRKLADRRLAELRGQVSNLKITEDARLSFADIAERWIATTAHALKESSSVTRRRTCIANLSPYFAGISISQRPASALRTLGNRSGGKDPRLQTMAHELNAMRNVFDYAVRLGLHAQQPGAGH